MRNCNQSLSRRFSRPWSTWRRAVGGFHDRQCHDRGPFFIFYGERFILHPGSAAGLLQPARQRALSATLVGHRPFRPRQSPQVASRPSLPPPSVSDHVGAVLLRRRNGCVWDDSLPVQNAFISKVKYTEKIIAINVSDWAYA